MEDEIPDTDILRMAEMPNIHILLYKFQLQWAGHVVRMVGPRLPNCIFYVEIHRKQTPEGPKEEVQVHSQNLPR